MRKTIQISITTLIFLVAVLLVGLKYADYVTNPWTRDGQVRANVIEVAPRVSGPIINLPIRDNQFVKAGDLLFEIDPRIYQASYAEARARLDETMDQLKALDKQVEAAAASVRQFESAIPQAKSQVDSAEAQLNEDEKQYSRALQLVRDDRISQANFDVFEKNRDVSAANLVRAQSALIQANAALIQAQANYESAVATRGAPGENNSQLRAARAALETARLNLDFTKVHASVDGHVANLTLRLGSQAVANQPMLALIDADSFWIDAYFRESFVGDIDAGNRAAITLMSYPDTVIPGVVDSVGRGIAQSDGSTGVNLLPQVSPTFEWIRLAQRIPVRIKVGDLPPKVELLVGTTASVLVMTGTDASDGDEEMPPPAPVLLQ